MTGLGVTTVSRALKDAPEIGEETRRRVQLVARQVGYRPNRAGVRLRTGKTNVISLVLNTEEQIGGFVSDMIYGISEHLAQTPYHLIVTPYSRTNDPLEPVRYVVETGSADGIIISRTEPDDKRVRYMLERGFPFATHGRTEVGTEHPFHDFDNYAFAREAVKKLAELGRKRLALLAPPLDAFLPPPHARRLRRRDGRDRLCRGAVQHGDGRPFDRADPRPHAAADAARQPPGRHRQRRGRRDLRAGRRHRGCRAEGRRRTSTSCRSSRRSCCICSGRSSTSSTRMSGWPAASLPAR